MSGFGDSRKLAAQFYFKDMTVLKVMFTAIIVAAVLIFLATGFRLLNYDRIWVNPTYLNSEILGGLIMGVGFIVGGFCPGTSLVAAATLKVDGIFFVLGGLSGVWAFGETVGGFEDFYNNSFYGRLTLPDWLGIPAGVVVLLVVLMALMMFYGAELAEAYFAGKVLDWRPSSLAKVAAAAAILAACGVLIGVGQPTPMAKWDRLKGAWENKLETRDVYVHPGEVLELKKNRTLYVRVLDVRPESDYNLFHVAGARRLDPKDVAAPATRTELLSAPDNTVFFLISNGETASTSAWKELKAMGILNVYIIEGGVNKWLEVFPPEPCVAERVKETRGNEAEPLLYAFRYAVGSDSRAAHPDSIRTQPWKACPSPGAATGTLAEASLPSELPYPANLTFTRKVKLQRKVAVKGGCG